MKLDAINIAWLLVGLVSFLVGGALLAGLWTIQLTDDLHYIDASLLRSSFWHGLLGAGIAGLQWLSGIGLIALIARTEVATPSRLAAYGFPASLLTTALALALGQMHIIAGLAAAGGVLGLAAVAILRLKPQVTHTALLNTALIFASAVVFAMWIAVFKHGPTATLEAYVSLDPIHYAGNILGLNQHGWPPPDLNFEGGQPHLFNLLWSGTGAATLTGFPIDPFQFIVASGNAAFIVLAASSMWMFGAEISRKRHRVIAPLETTIIAVAMLTGTFYVAWIGHSPPMIYAIPLIASFVLLLAELRHALKSGKLRLLLTATFGFTVLIAPLLTKVVLIGIFAPVSGALVLEHLLTRRSGTRDMTALLVIFILAAAVVVAGLFVFVIGMDVYNYLHPSPLSWSRYQSGNTGVLRFFLRDISGIIIGIGYVWLRPGLTSVGLLAILVIAVLFPAFLIAATIGVSLLIAFETLRSADTRVGPRLLILAGFLLAIPQTVFGDPSGVAIGFGWLVCLGGTVLLAQPCASRRSPAFRGFGMILALSGLTLASLAAASGRYPVQSGYWTSISYYPALTPETRDIWRAVDRCVPQSALVFTDQTGPTTTLEAYWNTYAQFGRRQVFVAGVGQSLAAVADSDHLDQRYRENMEVISGARRPQSVGAQREYEAFAMVSAVDPPDGWQQIYRNEKYVLSVWSDGSEIRLCLPTPD